MPLIMRNLKLSMSSGELSDDWTKDNIVPLSTR